MLLADTFAALRPPDGAIEVRILHDGAERHFSAVTSLADITQRAAAALQLQNALQLFCDGLHLVEFPLHGRHEACWRDVVAQAQQELILTTARPDYHALGSADMLTEFLTVADYQGLLCEHLPSRIQLAPLLRLNRETNLALRRSLGLRYLGLFRTPFGRANCCRLHAHQLRSLRHMHAAESPAGWSFGELRGGILADDPGVSPPPRSRARPSRCPPATLPHSGLPHPRSLSLGKLLA